MTQSIHPICAAFLFFRIGWIYIDRVKGLNILERPLGTFLQWIKRWLVELGLKTIRWHFKWPCLSSPGSAVLTVVLILGLIAVLAGLSYLYFKKRRNQSSSPVSTDPATEVLSTKPSWNVAITQEENLYLRGCSYHDNLPDQVLLLLFLYVCLRERNWTFWAFWFVCLQVFFFFSFFYCSETLNWTKIRFESKTKLLD